MKCILFLIECHEKNLLEKSYNETLKFFSSLKHNSDHIDSYNGKNLKKNCLIFQFNEEIFNYYFYIDE